MLAMEKEHNIKYSLFKSYLKEFLEKFSQSKKIIIAYSGGIDSSILLHLLFSIKKDLKQSLEAIHINHGLHDKSNDWEKFCRRKCESYIISFRAISIKENCPKNVPGPLLSVIIVS